MTEGQEKSLECPNCHRIDSVQKVSAIVKSGTSETNLNGNVIAGSYSFGDDGLSVGGGGFSASGTQITVLSKQLARPNIQPAGKSGCLTWLFLISVGLAIIFFGAMFSGENLGQTFLTFLILAGIAVLLFIPFNREHTRYSDYLREFRAKARLAKERWSHLYYCHRCDGVFVPGEALCPSDRMLTYLGFPDELRNGV